MNDIAERLRGKHLFLSSDGGVYWVATSKADPDCVAGAAEIERLRAIAAHLEQFKDDIQYMSTEIERLRRMIERLRAIIAKAQETFK